MSTTPAKSKKRRGKNRKPKRAGGIIFNENFDEILLIKGRMHQKWGIPKGHLERNESFIKGGIREILEETGIKIFRTETQNSIPKVKIEGASLFTFYASQDRCKLNPEDTNEIMEIGWKPINQLNELDSTTRMLKEVIRRIAQIREKAKTMNCLTINNMIIVNEPLIR